MKGWCSKTVLNHIHSCDFVRVLIVILLSRLSVKRRRKLPAPVVEFLFGMFQICKISFNIQLCYEYENSWSKLFMEIISSWTVWSDVYWLAKTKKLELESSDNLNRECTDKNIITTLTNFWSFFLLFVLDKVLISELRSALKNWDSFGSTSNLWC